MPLASRGAADIAAACVGALVMPIPKQGKFAQPAAADAQLSDSFFVDEPLDPPLFLHLLEVAGDGFRRQFWMCSCDLCGDRLRLDGDLSPAGE